MNRLWLAAALAAGCGKDARPEQRADEPVGRLCFAANPAEGFDYTSTDVKDGHRIAGSRLDPPFELVFIRFRDWKVPLPNAQFGFDDVRAGELVEVHCQSSDPSTTCGESWPVRFAELGRDLCYSFRPEDRSAGGLGSGGFVLARNTDRDRCTCFAP